MAKFDNKNTNKQASMRVNPVVFFPNKLMDPAFDGKRVYIRIYKSKTPSDIAKLIKDGVSKQIESVKKGVGEVAKGNYDSMLKIGKEIDYFNGEEEWILALPLPNEFSDSQTHSFNTGTGIIHDILNSVGASGTISNALGKIAANTSSQKILANPGYYQNYTGSEPRQFSFTFKLIPNSNDEFSKIKAIILMLKKYSSPSLHNGAIMIAPHFFWFSFSNKELQDLTGIRPCIINSISTNYAGSGILETTFDGAPKFIELTIAISELRTLTEDKW